ncbi:MAG TPA: S8 family serine peptidase [Thermoanaerobaculia bacterium]|nr:S8 family serine peptidase [Thermoanaerobaculia bacterium]
MLSDRDSLRRNLSLLALVLLCGAVQPRADAIGESPSQARSLTIGGPPLDLTLAAGGATWFRVTFKPSPKFSHFRLRTTGDNDTCLELYRDLATARAGQPIVRDDDSGDGANSAIAYFFGYRPPLYLKLERCGRTGSGEVRLISERFLQEPEQCDSGDCVFAASLAGRHRGAGALALLRQVRDVLESTPEGRRWRDLYWEVSAELLDDVVGDPAFRRELSGRVERFVPALRAALDGGEAGQSARLTVELVLEAEALRALVADRLSPRLAARLDFELDELGLSSRVGMSFGDVLSELKLTGSGGAASGMRSRERAVLVKLGRRTSGEITLRRGRASTAEPRLDAILSRYDVTELARVFPAAEEPSGLDRVYRLTLADAESAGGLLAEIRGEGSVEYAELDGEVRAFTKDVYFPYQYGLLPRAEAAGGIDAVRAWATSQGAPSILVAVVDTGVDYYHADLKGCVRRDLGHDYADGDADAMDDHGHGTHVAGIIAASFDNGYAVAGIAPRVRIVPLRVLGANGKGSFSSVAAGIEAAARAGARVINLSLGSKDFSQVMEDALRFAEQRGALAVAAAGNDGAATLSYPARSKYTLAVGATDSQGRRAGFSNQGPGLDISGPGVEIVSTWKDGQACFASGTSMAAPHVVGVAALVLSRRPALSRQQLAAILTSTARDAGQRGYDTEYGWGIVDAARALAAAK